MTASLRPDWLGKSLAGLLLGLGLGLAASGLFMQLQPGGAEGQFLVARYLLLTVWACAMSLVFLFGNAARAWLWLGATNAAAWLLLALTARVGP